MIRSVYQHSGREATASLGIICAALLFLAASLPGQDPDPVQLHGGLDNCRIRFEGAPAGHLTLLGGSIPETDGDRPFLMESLKKRCPATLFRFTDAGIASRSLSADELIG